MRHTDPVTWKAQCLIWLVAVFLLPVFALSSCAQQSNAPGQIINADDSFSLSLELAGEVPRIDDFRIMQGGCVTEDYAYFAMLSEENFDAYILSKCYILKYDRRTMQEVARSEVLQLGHANDITYIPETNELYVIHVVNRKVSVLDADTLTVKDSKRMQLLDGYAIAYNETRDSFVTGILTAGMGFFDRDLKVLDSAEALDTTLVTQGICADDQYIYHILYATKSNTEEPAHMIFVRDWDGNLITKIPVDLKECEPENISLVGDTFYIGFNNSDWTGGLVYTGKLVKNEG